MTTALRNKPPRITRKISIDDFIPPDDEHSALCALLAIYPLEACNPGDDHGDLVEVIMVGWGDVFRNRANDYQNRYAKAAAELDQWCDANPTRAADDAESCNKHLELERKHLELERKYDVVGLALINETRFAIVEVLKA